MRDRSVMHTIDALAAKGMTTGQIAQITGRDSGYVDYRVQLYRTEKHGSPDPWRIDPDKDQEFVRRVRAEARRLGLMRAA